MSEQASASRWTPQTGSQVLTDLARSRVGNAAIVEELHGDGVTSGDSGDLGVGSVGERSKVATEVGVIGGKVVVGVGVLGGHVVLSTSGLTNVLPVVGGDSVQNKLAEDVMSSRRLGKPSGSNESGGSLHGDGKGCEKIVDSVNE